MPYPTKLRNNIRHAEIFTPKLPVWSFRAAAVGNSFKWLHLWGQQIKFPHPKISEMTCLCIFKRETVPIFFAGKLLLVEHISKIPNGFAHLAAVAITQSITLQINPTIPSQRKHGNWCSKAVPHHPPLATYQVSRSRPIFCQYQLVHDIVGKILVISTICCQYH